MPCTLEIEDENESGDVGVVKVEQVRKFDINSILKWGYKREKEWKNFREENDRESLSISSVYFSPSSIGYKIHNLGRRGCGRYGWIGIK